MRLTPLWVVRDHNICRRSLVRLLAVPAVLLVFAGCGASSTLADQDGLDFVDANAAAGKACSEITLARANGSADPQDAVRRIRNAVAELHDFTDDPSQHIAGIEQPVGEILADLREDLRVCAPELVPETR